MKFQLLKLIIWPVKRQFGPQIIKFELGKLNVITGASRTGKSAIIPIIDYCLASSDCNVPIDTIRDHASWYGVVVQAGEEQILFAREVPKGNKLSDKFFMLRGKSLVIPDVIEAPNQKTENIKHLLNEISGVSYIALDSDDEKKPYSARLGFRDLMSLVFQNQDIVANQNILFYKTHSHEHRERLRNWFPFILGAETIEILISRQRLRDIERKLNRLRREYSNSKEISSSWVSSLFGKIEVAKEYGLTNEDLHNNISSEDLLSIAKQVLDTPMENPHSTYESIDSATKEISELQHQENILSNKIAAAKKRLNDIRNLKSGLNEYSDSVKKRVDRLQISQWMEDLAVEAESCPACGSKEHPNSSAELKKISLAFKKYENESKVVANVPTSFAREEESVRKELESLTEEQKLYRARYDLVVSQNKGAQEEFQKRKNMFLFLGHLKASVENFEKLSDDGELWKEIESLEKESKTLSKIIDQGAIDRKISAITAEISQKTLTHLKTLDVEGKYKTTAPQFSVKDLNIKVLSSDGNWHFLAEVGSASNWVSFHIALMCALQEYFLEQRYSCVPSFVIFDQPSQVYFPKVNRGSDSSEQDIIRKYDDEDIDAVKKMFQTIASSILSTSGNWQGIILDHADGDVYSDIEGVVEIAEWRHGKKLIPEQWYN